MNLQLGNVEKYFERTSSCAVNISIYFSLFILDAPKCLKTSSFLAIDAHSVKSKLMQLFILFFDENIDFVNI